MLDDFTVRFNLSQPFSPLFAQLSDRAGMIVSPKAAKAAKPADFANHPVCSGPYTLPAAHPAGADRGPQVPGYWNAANVHFDEVQYLTMPDAVVRFANVQSGQLDIAERIQATDLARGQGDARLKMYTVPSFSYNHLHINTNKPPRNNTPLAQNAKLREALDLAIDRKALVQAVSNGVFLPGNQLVPPTSQWYIKEFPVQGRNIERAKQLVKEAGFTPVPVNLQILNATLDVQVAQIIQAMARDAGFDIKIEAQETGTAVARYFAGDFELFGGLWSGRVDPDGNVPTFLALQRRTELHQILQCGTSTSGGRGTAEVGPPERYKAIRKPRDLSGRTADDSDFPPGLGVRRVREAARLYALRRRYRSPRWPEPCQVASLPQRVGLQPARAGQPLPLARRHTDPAQRPVRDHLYVVAASCQVVGHDLADPLFGGHAGGE